MGTDKAFLVVDGATLVERCADALRGAGATDVVVVGGDRRRLEALGLLVVDDQSPGEGPLGGLITGLASAEPSDTVVVLPCDLRAPSVAVVAAVVAALDANPEAAVAVPERDHRPEWLHAAWRPARALPTLSTAFEAGERSVWRAASSLEAVMVLDVAEPALADVDVPGDLPASSRPGPPSK